MALALQMSALPRLRPPGERLTRPPIRETLAQLIAEVRPCFRGIFILWLMVVLRAVTLNCFLQFVSIYHGEAHGLSKLAGAALAAGLMMSMALAGLLAVRAAERFGMRLTLGLSFLSGVLVLIGSLGAAHSGWIWSSYCLLLLGGALLGGSVPINVAAGQKLLRRSAALGSGIMIGLGWGTGGLLVPLAAKIGELCGGAELQDRTAVTLLVAALMALPGAALALLLPKKTRPAG